MMRADDLNLHAYPVRTKMTGTKQIPVLHVCSKFMIKSENFLMDRTLSQICSTDEEESESIIVDESSKEES